jgi:hypothetical protein
MIGLVTCLFNPAGYSRTKSKYREFRENLQNIPLVTVELSWDGKFESADGIHLHADSSNILWQKERLINIGIDALPDQCDKVAWVDADLIFTNPNWVNEADKVLESKQIVQLFERVINLGPDRNPVDSVESWGSACQREEPDIVKHHVGHAWAVRRDLLKDGLYDRMIIGGGDWLMADAWFGRGDQGVLSLLPPRLKRDFQDWNRVNFPDPVRDIGCVPGEILHLYHGDKSQRRYNSRYQVLWQNDFDPVIDIEKNSDGVWAWATKKTGLADGVKKYFQVRNEDADPPQEVKAEDVAFMTPDETILWKKALASANRYLEFGAGKSTVAATKFKNISHIDSVESHKEFAQHVEQVTEIQQAKANGRLKLHVIDIGETESWGYPKDFARQSHWRDYPEVVHRLDGPWDTVLIDGRFRVACAMNVLLCVNRETVILIHDFWNRNAYHVLLNFVDIEASVDTLGVFRKRTNCDHDHLLKLREKYYDSPF